MNKYFNSRMKKILALVLSCAVAVSSVFWAGFTTSSNAADKTEEKTETQEAIEAEYPELLASHSEDGVISKEEITYIVTDADGTVKDTSVTEWLRNGSGADSINDVSDLEDIENTSNDKTFTREGRNLVWSADGCDIKYRGTTDKEMPVSVNISYYLDGQKTTAEDIAGKAGNVTIRFDYDVNSRVSAGGYDFATPYTMASGLILNDEHFTDVKVNDGKVIDDGSRCICLGIAFPGLADSLDIHSTEYEIPESVSVSAYTDCFEIDGTYTAALSGLLSDIDISGSDSIDSKIEELESAMDKLGDASSKLVEGADQLSDGAYKLSAGADKVSTGAEKVSSYTDQLADGLSQISSNSGDLNNGAGEVFNTLLSTAQTQLEANDLKVGDLTISNYKDKLGKVIDSLDKDKVYSQALSKVTAEVEKNRSVIESAVTEKVKEAVTEQVTQAVKAEVTKAVTEAVRENVSAAVIKEVCGLSPEEYEAAIAAGQIDEATQKAIEQAIDSQMASESIQNTIDSQVNSQMGSDEIKAKIAETTEAQMGTDAVKQQISNATEAKIQELINQNMESDEVQEQLAAAEAGAQSVIALKTSLDKYNAFYLGVLAYTSAVDKASAGASQLADGAADLSSGSSELAAGASELYEGAKKLYDGMDTFDKDGINKLISSLDDAGIEALFDRFSALTEASEQVSLIGGIADGMKGESKIIIKSGAVKAE